MENNNESKNYILMIGNELKSKMSEKGITQKELAEKIAKKFPLKDNGKKRTIKTTKDNLSRIVNGHGIHLDTFNKAVDILGISRILFLD